MRNICNRRSVFEAIAERGYCFFVFGRFFLDISFGSGILKVGSGTKKYLVYIVRK
ncbi:hypothetical protein D931_02037 [Enterococcus faecium 13.SD.W.09]|nr:hypothetical protein D931_02037 [Enterococcus faecium 13.SD.W.09]